MTVQGAVDAQYMVKRNSLLLWLILPFSRLQKPKQRHMLLPVCPVILSGSPGNFHTLNTISTQVSTVLYQPGLSDCTDSPAKGLRDSWPRPNPSSASFTSLPRLPSFHLKGMAKLPDIRAKSGGHLWYYQLTQSMLNLWKILSFLIICSELSYNDQTEAPTTTPLWEVWSPYLYSHVLSLPSTQCLGNSSTDQVPLLASLPGVCKALNEPVLTAPLMPSSPLLDGSATHRPNSPLKV